MIIMPLTFPRIIGRIAEKFSRLGSCTQAEDSKLFFMEAYLRIGSRLKLMKETHEKIRIAYL
jgi:hypothetical protein